MHGEHSIRASRIRAWVEGLPIVVRARAAITFAAGRVGGWNASLTDRRMAWLLAGVLACFHAGHALLGAEDRISAGTYDTLMKRRLWVPSPDPRILVADLDEHSIAVLAPEIGLWPWPRDVFANLLDYFERRGATAVVFDVLFTEPDAQRPAADAAFAAALEKSRIAWLPALRLAREGDAISQVRMSDLPGMVTRTRADADPLRTIAIAPPYMAAAVGGGRFGYLNVEPDGDGTLRRFAFTEEIDGWRVHSLPARIAVELNGSAPTGTRLLQWGREAPRYPRVSVAEFVRDADRRESQRPADELRGKIVVVGATAAGLHDLHPTTVATRHPGVDILANAIDDALNDRAKRTRPHWLEAPLVAASIVAMLVLVLTLQKGTVGQLLVRVPLALMAVSWASLHFGTLFVDLTVIASSALAYFSALKLAGSYRSDYWTDRMRFIAGRAPGAGSTVVTATLAPDASAGTCELEAFRILGTLAADDGGPPRLLAPRSGARVIQRADSGPGDMTGACHDLAAWAFPSTEPRNPERFAAALRAHPGWRDVAVTTAATPDEPRELTVRRAFAAPRTVSGPPPTTPEAVTA